MCRVGVVVLHYRRGAETAATIQALLGQSLAPARVLVVDNDSGDASVGELVAAVPGLDLLRAPTNGGWAAGMRLGLAELGSGYDAYALLTHDSVLEPGALAALAAVLRDEPSVGAVGPVLSPPGAPDDAVFSSGGFIDRRGWTPLNHETPVRELVDREWLDGACILLRPGALVAPRLLDDRYFLYLEDVHLGLALLAAGWRVTVTPAARARQSTAGMPLYYGVRNRLIVARTWGGFRAVVRRLAWDTLSLGADVVYRRGTLMRWRLRGIADGVRGRGGPAPPGSI